MPRRTAPEPEDLHDLIYQQNLADLNNKFDDPRDHIRLMKKAPRYAALSYSWGAGVPESAYLCVVVGSKDVDLPISQDLFDAIRRSEAHSEQEWLWIDAVCIDQSDASEEKENQVAMMRDIYSHAECVLVWLGEEVHDESNEHDRETTHFDKLDPALTFTKLQQLIDQGDSVWWSRVWIIQEISVARNVMVRIGSSFWSWDEFVEATRLTSERFSVHLLLTENASEHLAAERQRLQDDIHAMRQQITHLDNLRKAVSTQGYRPLRSLLRSSGNSRSSEARDKIYALLGISSPEVRGRIGVSYTVKPAQVFATACMAIINTEDCLDILVDQWPRFYGQPLYSSKTTSPSFVPDFSGVIRTFPCPLSWTTGICASGSSKPNAKYGWNDLKVQGLKFDRITRVWRGLCELAHETTSSQHLAIVHQQIVPIVYGILEKDTSWQLPGSSRSLDLRRASRIWQTLTSDYDPYQVTPEDAEQKQQVIDIIWWSREAEFEFLISALGPLVQEAEILASQICKTLAARVVFSTSTGFFGIAAPEVQAEDVIVVPFGASAPFVLRRVPDQLPGIESYALVVDCNVNGIMEGELMELYEQGQIEAEVFDLD